MIIAIYTTIHGVFHRIELLCSILNGRLVYKPIIQAGYYVLEGPHPSTMVDTFNIIIKPCLGFFTEIHGSEHDVFPLVLRSCKMVNLQPSQQRMQPAIELFDVLIT
jgi:hypothetical protein